MTIQDIVDLQKKLSNLIGVSGYEDEVRQFLEQEIKDLVDEIKVDSLGNLLAIKQGTNPNAHKILFDAHMDEVGFMINHIEPDGYLRFIMIGGWDTRTLLSQSVVIKSNHGTIIHGVIGAKPPHIMKQEDRENPIKVEELYIDIGMLSKEEVENQGITLGTTGTLHDPIIELPNNYLRARALDDRLGCNLIVQLLRKLKNLTLEETILVSFTVQEEVGLRGAGPAAYTLNPTMAIAVESTTAANVPDVKKMERPTETGLGPSITIKDSGTLSSKKVNDRLVENARLAGITYQIKRPVSKGGTNVGKIHLTKGGIPSSIVSVPCKYIHSPVSMASMDDALSALNLLEAFVLNKAKIQV
jgi:endoglucanase